MMVHVSLLVDAQHRGMQLMSLVYMCCAQSFMLHLLNGDMSVRCNIEARRALGM